MIIKRHPCGLVSNWHRQTHLSQNLRPKPETIIHEHKYFNQISKHSISLGLHCFHDVKDIARQSWKQRGDQIEVRFPTWGVLLLVSGMDLAPSQTPITHTGAEETLPSAWCWPVTRCRWYPYQFIQGSTTYSTVSGSYLSGEKDGTCVACLLVPGKNLRAAL
jgi:hypothetical protein